MLSLFFGSLDGYKGVFMKTFLNGTGGKFVGLGDSGFLPSEISGILSSLYLLADANPNLRMAREAPKGEWGTG